MYERKANHGNKLRTYRTFKNDFKTESYVKYCTNESHRTALARFRLGAHHLNIETQRYIKPRIPPENRICNNCDIGETEDEFHFIMRCKHYEYKRRILFQDVNAKFDYFSSLTEECKFKWLCSSNDIHVINLLGNYIELCFEART